VELDVGEKRATMSGEHHHQQQQPQQRHRLGGPHGHGQQHPSSPYVDRLPAPFVAQQQHPMAMLQQIPVRGGSNPPTPGTSPAMGPQMPYVNSVPSAGYMPGWPTASLQANPNSGDDSSGGMNRSMGVGMYNPFFHAAYHPSVLGSSPGAPSQSKPPKVLAIVDPITKKAKEISSAASKKASNESGASGSKSATNESSKSDIGKEWKERVRKNREEAARKKREEEARKNMTKAEIEALEAKRKLDDEKDERERAEAVKRQEVARKQMEEAELKAEREKKEREERERVERQRKQQEEAKKRLEAAKREKEEEERAEKEAAAAAAATAATQEAAARKTSEENVTRNGAAPAVNGGGPRAYSYEELMELKEKCRDKPDSLEGINFQIVPMRPGLQRSGSSGGGSGRAFDRTPQGSGSGRQGGPQWPRGAIGSQRGARGARGGPNVPAAIPLIPSTPLQVSENAWKPKEAQDDHEATVKEVKGILNKLTLEKFDRLSKRLAEIPITSLEILKELIAAIHQKALSEAKFGEIYADLCRVMVEETTGKTWDFINVVERDGQFFWTTTNDESKPDAERLVGPFDTKDKALEKAQKMTDFKRILLNKCQEEFEKEMQIAEAEQEVESLKEKLKGPCEGNEKEETRAALQSANYKALRIKRNVLGNIQFIGELFKKKILNEKVMHSCIIKILNPAKEVPEEEDLECLCKLLTTIGYTLDSSTSEKTKEYVKQYFAKLEEIAKNASLPARQKFMVLDVIDLRKNGWQARREELKAKKINEVHKDAAREEQEKARQSRMAGGVGGGGGGGGRFSGHGGNRGSSRGGGAGGSSFQFGNNNSKGSLLPNQAKRSTLGGGMRIGGGAAAKVGGSSGIKVGGSLKKDALPLGAAGSSASSSNLGQSLGGGAFRPGGGKQSSLGLARPIAGGGSGRAGKFGSSRNLGPQRASSGSGSSPTPASAAAEGSSTSSATAAPKDAISSQVMKNKVNGTLEEYVAINSTEELVESIKDIILQVSSEDELKDCIINHACYMIVEKKEDERRHVPQALTILAKEMDFLTREDFISSLCDRLAGAGDEMMDNPMNLNHYAALIVRLVQNDLLKLEDLPAITEKFVAETPHYMKTFCNKIVAAFKDAGEDAQEIFEEQKDSIPAHFITTHDLKGII